MHYKFNLFHLTLGLLACLFFINTPSTLALENNNKFYTNQNGIQVTTKEYEFISNFYGAEFFNNMNTEDLDWIQDLNLDIASVEIKDYIEKDLNTVVPFSTTHSTASKKLSIAKSCTTICTIIIKVEWLNNPSIRSYDVIGARLDGTKLANNNMTTKVVSSSGTQNFSNNKILVNGVGTSVKLPSNASNIRIEQKFYTTLGGTIYGSYQHATKNISLQTSQMYSIDSLGYGSVFKFTGSAIQSFDGMGGVSISL